MWFCPKLLSIMSMALIYRIKPVLEIFPKLLIRLLIKGFRPNICQNCISWFVFLTFRTLFAEWTREDNLYYERKISNGERMHGLYDVTIYIAAAYLKSLHGH